MLPVLLFSLFVTLPVKADILVVTNAKNSLDVLTLQEVKKIFLGRMTRFPDSGKDITVLDLDDKQKLYDEFYNKVIRMDSNRLKRYRARFLFSGKGMLPEKASDQQAVLGIIQSKETAIGYIELAPEESLPADMKVVFRFERQE